MGRVGRPLFGDPSAISSFVFFWPPHAHVFPPPPPFSGPFPAFPALTLPTARLRTRAFVGQNRPLGGAMSPGRRVPALRGFQALAERGLARGGPVGSMTYRSYETHRIHRINEAAAAPSSPPRGCGTLNSCVPRSLPATVTDRHAMKKTLAAAAVLMLAVAAVASNDPERLWSQPAVPSRNALDRLNLDLAWAVYVPMDGKRDGFASIQLDGNQLIAQTRSGMITVLDAENGGRARGGRGRAGPTRPSCLRPSTAGPCSPTTAAPSTAWTARPAHSSGRYDCTSPSRAPVGGRTAHLHRKRRGPPHRGACRK